MEKYIHFKALDFSQEDSFIRWAKEKANAGDFDWDQWLINHPEKSEELTLAKNIVKSINFKTIQTSNSVKEDIWKNIATITEEKQTPARKSTVLRWMSIASAAAAVVFLVMVNIGGNMDTLEKTSIAEVKIIDLPDGSKVNINANSSIAYNQSTWEKDRSLELDGEAFFQVTKGSKFTVKTKLGNIVVLGTSFNVYMRNDMLNVQCETGKVGVGNAVKQTILKPKEAVQIKNGEHFSVVNIEQSTLRSNWRQGVFVYKEANLRQVIMELERQLNIQITIDQKLMNLNYSGSFNKSDMDGALSEVFWPLGLKYSRKGSKVNITKE